MHQLPSAPPFALQLTPDEVVRQLRYLPSAPQVLPKLKKLLGNGNSALHEVVALIRVDPGIAARVLQMGNSAYFSHGSRCYTVDEAVNRVGFDNVYELVANAVSSQVLIRPLTTYGLEADELWRMSVSCALAAEVLAEHLHIDQDVAYTIGLFHGVGLVAIDEWAYRQHPELRFVNTSLPLETCVEERKILGFHNAEAGAALLRLWEFPNIMSEPLRWQYVPRGTSAHLKLSSLLHVAKWLRSATIDQTEPPMPEASLLRTLGLSISQLGLLTETVSARLAVVNSLLDIGNPEKATIAFPNGEREIANNAPIRNFINLYA